MINRFKKILFDDDHLISSLSVLAVNYYIKAMSELLTLISSYLGYSQVTKLLSYRTFLMKKLPLLQATNLRFRWNFLSNKKFEIFFSPSSDSCRKRSPAGDSPRGRLPSLHQQRGPVPEPDQPHHPHRSQGQ